MKNFTIQEMCEKYNKLSNSNKVTILYSALGYMQSYNGRSINDCIFMAMGYESSSNDTWTKEREGIL